MPQETLQEEEGQELVTACPEGECRCPRFRFTVEFTALYNFETGKVEVDWSGEGETANRLAGMLCKGCGKPHPNLDGPLAENLWDAIDEALQEGPDD